MPPPDHLLADLTAEGEELDRLVAPLSPEQWDTATPAAGWSVRTQVAHLYWTDEVAVLSATDPAQFQAELERALAEIDGYTDRAAQERAELPVPVLLERWRMGRQALREALAAVPDGTRLPWFGPPMSAATMATARLMETWAHGQDVADALGVTRVPTARLRSIAHIGVRTRDFAFLVRDRPVPGEEFRVELTAPDGTLWAWGPEDAAQSVRGPALDFALVVTQRRHRDDTALLATGPDADAWLEIAQAFAGPPGTGREPEGPPGTGRAPAGRR